MTQTYWLIPGRRADVRRPGAVYLHITRRVDRYGMPVDGVEDGYVGRARDVARRTAQHAGLIPQRSGEIVESAWFDLKEGETVVLESGLFTDAELDERERAWIGKLRPRYNDRDNPRPDRIRKFEARRHRDTRDAARGLVPRQWEPSQIGVKPAKSRAMSAKWRRRRNVALAYVGAWAGLTVLLWLLTAAACADLPWRTFPIAATGAVGAFPMLRRSKKQERLFIVVVVTVACVLLWAATD
ncbi:hypothetical protein ABT369_38965 [Dactylosporangium sp. NPDC000244]|uniref:hypothetical protein n=1 Tax=Dactylosporangium sp. NPDC000244 TaxID=3154365 RepID=UPI00332E97D9